MENDRASTAVVASLLLALGCDPELPVSEMSDSGGSTGGDPGASTTADDTATTGAADGSSGVEPETSTGEVVDAELDALANLRGRDLYGLECLDLRKLGATADDPRVAVLVDVPPSNMAMAGEETAERVYDLAADTELAQLRAFVGVGETLDCEVEPTEGTLFRAIAGTIIVTYEVVDDGCLFTCERLFVEADDLVLERESDGATVELDKLYVPSWIDPMPP